MTPGAAELGGAVGRFDFDKTFTGELSARGHGLMLSAGDPREGEAAYIAIETLEGRLGERWGGFAFAQLGTMHDGAAVQHYEVVPGSGHGELAGITGSLALTVDPDGTHRYELAYEL
jgi:hypothetical protein